MNDVSMVLVTTRILLPRISMLLQMRDATCITVSHTPIMTELTQKATMSLVT